MNHLFLFSAVCVVLVCGGGQAADEDLVEKKLIVAKEELDKVTEKARAGLLADLKKKQDVAQKAGDLKSLVKVQNEAKAFEEGGELPKSVPVKGYEEQLRIARARLEEAYRDTVKEYTKAGKIAIAKAIQQQLDEFQRGGSKRPGKAARDKTVAARPELTVPGAARPELAVSGTTAARPELTKVFNLNDNLIPFEIRNATGQVIFAGKVQNRVGRSSTTGTLCFDFFIRDTTPGLPGRITEVRRDGFGGWKFDANYRTDSMGTIGPDSVNYTPDGTAVRFLFDKKPITAGAFSHSCFVFTDATKFDKAVSAKAGSMVITADDGSTVTIKVATPIK